MILIILPLQGDCRPSYYTGQGTFCQLFHKEVSVLAPCSPSPGPEPHGRSLVETGWLASAERQVGAENWSSPLPSLFVVKTLPAAPLCG